MKNYQRIAVASAFSPTFASVLTDARRFAEHCGASLEVIHAGERSEEKEQKFQEVLGGPAPIHWVQGDTPARAIATVAGEFDLLFAGALHREDGEKPFTSSVARELLQVLPGDLLLAPAIGAADQPLHHAVFALDPSADDGEFILKTAKKLGFQKVTIVAAETPFAAALAASRGESTQNLRSWGDELAGQVRSKGLDADSWIVTSNTGYALCDAIQGINADLLIVRATGDGPSRPLPHHMDWLSRIIPLRMLLVKP